MSFAANVIRVMSDAAREHAETETGEQIEIPTTPIGQASELEPTFVPRPHLVYLAERLAAAVTDVENGIDRRIIVNMPARMGKSTMVAIFLLVWILRRHPSWKTALVSAEATLPVSWSRTIRDFATTMPNLGITVKADAARADEWQTTELGGVLARGLKGMFTGRGAKVLVVDDPHRDFADAHSETSRNAVWNWWLSTGLKRLEPPSLVIVVMTRWHQEDLCGRLLSREYEGDPDDWEVIRFPSIADHRPEDGETDLLGREPGEALLSPLLPDETPEQAKARAEKSKRDSGSYAFAAMDQQRPAPAKGAIWDVDWWRYWTVDPGKVTEDGRIILWDPAAARLARDARWLESWDMAFKGTDDSDFVVGGRWCRQGPNRFLTRQLRARMSFTKTLDAVLEWAEDPDWADVISYRLVEDKANGTAVIDLLRKRVPGFKAINPTDSKVARARACTPEVETGNVYLPHPTDPGNEWVIDYLDEFRNFPTGSHDDQVDATSQALTFMRRWGSGSAVVSVGGMSRRVG